MPARATYTAAVARVAAIQMAEGPTLIWNISWNRQRKASAGLPPLPALSGRRTAGIRRFIPHLANAPKFDCLAAQIQRGCALSHQALSWLGRLRARFGSASRYSFCAMRYAPSPQRFAVRPVQAVRAQDPGPSLCHQPPFARLGPAAPTAATVLSAEKTKLKKA